MTDVDLEVVAGAVSITAAGDLLGRYVFEPSAAADEAPRPYWHPLRTLGGVVITDDRPADHRWHRGLSMTWSVMSGQNFWGGPTYERGAGYVQRENVGRIRHERFRSIDGGGSGAALVEELTWTTAAGLDWIAEKRAHRVHGVDPARGRWILDVSTVLRNVRSAELVLGSPATEGRDGAGYTGLFLRLAPSWRSGLVTSPAGEGEGAVLGRRVPWVAFQESGGLATVVVFAGTSSATTPVGWFVRSAEYPGVAPSPAFAVPIVLPADRELRLTHRLVVVDGGLHDQELASVVAECTP